MDIGGKIINTGTKTVEVLKETGNIVKEKVKDTSSYTVDILKDTTNKVVNKSSEVVV